jgi:hypothetical protein
MPQWWIVKVDDDMYLRSLHLYNTASSVVDESSSDSTSVPIVMGCIQYDIPVQRYGKWAEPSWLYEQYPIYPPWPKGSCGYAFNDVVAKIITQKYNQDIQTMTRKNGTNRTTQTSWNHRDRRFLELPSYQGEDTSLGIWLQHSNVSWIHSPFFVNHGNCRQVSLLLSHWRKWTTMDLTTTSMVPKGSNTSIILPWCIGHRMTSEQIQYCYDIEPSIIHNNNDTIQQFSPFDYTRNYLISIDDNNNNNNNKSNHNNNNTEYHIAMIRHEADEMRLRRKQDIEERLERRNRIKQLRYRSNVT